MDGSLRGRRIPIDPHGPVHYKPEADGLEYFDPRAGKGLPFLIGRFVHVVDNVEFVDEVGIIYDLRCGESYTFFVEGGPKGIKEARVKLPSPDCELCLKSLSSQRSRR